MRGPDDRRAAAAVSSCPVRICVPEQSAAVGEPRSLGVLPVHVELPHVNRTCVEDPVELGAAGGHHDVRRAARRQRRAIDVGVVQEVHVEDDEALLPPVQTGFQGYRLLQEYFAFPERLLFFRVSGLRAAFVFLTHHTQ